MNINLAVLSKLKPCIDRFDNYKQHYKEFNDSFDEFLDLPDISYEDKIWVAKRVLNKNQLVHFGLLCAESVLNIFEKKHPEDKRVRDCIEYLIKIPDFGNITDQQREEILNHRRDAAAAAAAAAYAADAAYADAAYADAAADAAYAAYAYAYAYAAADAAYAAYAYAYAYAAAADAAADAAYAYAYAYAARINQQNLNIQFLKMAATL